MHISFSELKNWDKCPYYHKLTYIDRINKFQGNEFTAFGTAVHTVCEHLLLGKISNDSAPLEFKKEFLKELKSLPKEHEFKKDLVFQMKEQGVDLTVEVLAALDEYFENGYEVVSTEEDIMEPVKGFIDAKYNFKGFIDAVLKTPDGKYHVIDWKTCGWGWDARKKADRITTYQLTFYKHFFALKHNISPKNIETHFALLKRTAKKDRIELFRVTSGSIKTKNAIKFLTEALYNIHKKKYIKNRSACSGCEFLNTPHCT